MKLNYKASNIAAAEQKSGLNFFTALGELGSTPSVSALLFMFEAGGATTEDFDAAMEKGLEATIIEIFDAIADSGFLGSSAGIDKATLKKEVEKLKQEQKTTANSTSPASGKDSK